MSLGIERSKVSSVLLAGEWIACEQGSFYIDAYEYMWSRDQHDDHDWNPMNEHGFTFTRKSDGFQVFGPMTSIQAVTYKISQEENK